MRESWVAPGPVDHAADLLLGRTCAGCDRPGPLLCPDCREWLDGWGPRLVRPRPAPAGLPEVAASAPYVGPLRPIIHRYKEGGAWALAGVLGERVALAGALVLATAAREGRWDAVAEVLVVPAPSRPQAVRRRGSDVTARLAGRASARLRALSRAAVRADAVLATTGPTADQAGLGTAARRANLDHRLRLRHPVPPGRPVLLVDDVITTGATLREMTRVLHAAGCPVLGAATVGATPRDPDSRAGR